MIGLYVPSCVSSFHCTTDIESNAFCSDVPLGAPNEIARELVIIFDLFFDIQPLCSLLFLFAFQILAKGEKVGAGLKMKTKTGARKFCVSTFLLPFSARRARKGVGGKMKKKSGLTQNVFNRHSL